ncbi:MAG TPA: hypothetical protein PKM88_00525 [bacterium]|nr:hypothetical protein [bacterium]
MPNDELQETRQFYRRVIALTAGMALVAAMVAVNFGVIYFRQRDRAQQQHAALVRQVERMSGELAAETVVVAPPVTLSPADLQQLYRAGLRNPLLELTTDLLRHDDVIPLAGTQGGTMRFISPQDVYVLNRHWVLAHCTDGHQRGAVLLEYAVGDSGAIRWRAVAAARE